MFRILILLAFVLSACGPSQAQLETAIAETQAAQPTATSAPTATTAPTAEPKPLRDLVLAHSDFPTDLGDFYDKNPIELDKRMNVDVAVESISYLYSADGAPRLIINLARLQNAGQRVRTNRIIKETFLESGKTLKLPTNQIVLPEDVWAVETNENWLVAGWTNNAIVAVLEFEKGPNAETDTLAAGLAFFIQAQDENLRP